MKTFIYSLILISYASAESHIFSAQDVVAALKTGLQDKVNISGDFNVNLSPGKISIPHEGDEDTLTLQEVNFSSDQKNFQARMATTKGQEQSQFFTVSGKIEPLTDIPMLTRAITPGDIIEESDITWNKLPSNRLSQNFILKAEEIIGQTPKNRVMQPGQPISKHDVRAPIVIKRGDAVTIAYKTESMLLTTTAIAEKDAATGEIARFKTTNNNRIIQARVIGPQKAEINIVEF